MFYPNWTRIDMRKKETVPPVNTSVLLFVDGRQHVATIVGSRLYQKSTEPTHYVYGNTHRPLKGSKAFWMPLPPNPKTEK